jgi:hypothetical protein
MSLYECERCQLDMDPEEAQHTFWDCIDALKAELAAQRQAYETLTGLLKKRFPQRKDGSMPDYKVEDVLAENARIREALERYGWHTDECLDKCANTRSGNCTCGFNAALETSHE